MQFLKGNYWFCSGQRSPTCVTYSTETPSQVRLSLLALNPMWINNKRLHLSHPHACRSSSETVIHQTMCWRRLPLPKNQYCLATATIEGSECSKSWSTEAIEAVSWRLELFHSHLKNRAATMSEVHTWNLRDALRMRAWSLVETALYKIQEIKLKKKDETLLSYNQGKCPFGSLGSGFS